MSLGRDRRRPAEGRSNVVDPVDASRAQSLRSVATWSLRLRRRMQLAADISELFDQGGLDVHVHIFAFQNEGETVPSSKSAWISDNVRTICWHSTSVIKPTFSKHVRMGNRPIDVLLEKPMIEGDGFSKLLNAAVRFSAKTTTPRLTRHVGHSELARCSLHKLIA